LRKLIAVLVFLAPGLAFGSDFSVGPAPKWIDNVSVDTSATLAAGEARYGTYALLDDHQVDAGTTTENYYRRVRKILSPTGVQNASEISFDFDPTYERLVIHDVTILRDGKRKSVLDASSVRVIEKEDEQRDHLYDGILSAIAFVNDVRPGDVLDYSWSVEGANPLLGGRFADTFDLAADVPTKLIRHRLIFARPLHYRSTLAGIEPVIANGVYTWSRTNVLAINVEDNIPDWFDPYDHVQVSEFASWHDIALWSESLFQLNEPSRAAVTKLAQSIRAAHPQQRDQIVASIRFVQDQIRYLGIEMGRNSHQPHQPADVLEQRWGDCKDKSFLLASLLQELGVEAYPALVNTKLRHNMDRELPSPFEFDHVITQVRLANRTYWIDPTLSDQGGTLETIETPNDERALVVSKQTNALATIVTNHKGSTLVAMTYTSNSWDGPTTLLVQTTYSGGDADLVRDDLAGMTVADLAKRRINKFAADQPKIASAGAPQIHDDRDRNVIVLIEHYTIRDFWKSGSFAFNPHAIEDHLKRPETVIREMPLAVDYPLALHERVVFHLPSAAKVDGAGGTVETAALRYVSTVKDGGETVTIDYDLRTLRDGIAAKDVADHLGKVNSLLDGTGVTLARRASLEAAAAVSKSAAPTSMIVIILVIAAAQGTRRKRNRGKLS
jgi:transglutaminase-like putative cysteine protease